MLRCMSYTNSIHRTVAPSLEQLLSTRVILPLPGKRRHSFPTCCGNQSKDEIQETEHPLRLEPAACLPPSLQAIHLWDAPMYVS